MKFMGNKNRIANELVRVMLSLHPNADTFVDLFCGSCSVVKRVPDRFTRIANDNNEFLIEMIKALVDGVKFPVTIHKPTYDKARQDFYAYMKNKLELSDEEIARIGWIGWMASFNGRFFSAGYSGHAVYTKSGKCRDYIAEQIKNTLKDAPSWNGIKFKSLDYKLVNIPTGAIVYCDIPYKGTKQYDTSKNFDYEAFYDWCRTHKNKYHIYVSEYQMPDNFTEVWNQQGLVTINPDKATRPIEKLFTI